MKGKHGEGFIALCGAEMHEMHTRKITQSVKKIQDAQKSKLVYPNKRKQWKKVKRMMTPNFPN